MSNIKLETILVAKASEQLENEVLQELEEKDPEDAKEIINGTKQTGNNPADSE